MILAAVSPFFKNDLALLEGFSARPSLWAKDAAASVTAYKSDLSTDLAIGAMQNARRIIRIFTAGLENSAGLKAALDATPLTNWADFTEPPAPHATQDRLAEMLYVVRGTKAAPLLELGDQTRYMGVKLVEFCIADERAFDVSVEDENFMAVLFAACDDAAIAKLAAHTLSMREGIEARILAHQNLPVWQTLDAPSDKKKAYRTLLKPYRERVLSGKMRSVLTSIPTKRDAEVDGIPYDEYAELYFRMCDQPWDAIKAAQYKLIDTLNATKALRFTNSDGTDLSMSIDGFTFCNSTIARNIPGSEVFSAPAIDSTNGIIISKGRFAAKDDAGAVMEDLTLRFEKGVLVEATARVGQEHLTRAISTDEGARRIGEIGIGTNPYLKRHVASILLCEKIGGSFHVALGDAYTMTDYMGDPVVVDNGNRSLLHWDVTTMLHGKSGMIYADGKTIMENGVFTDPALDVLNRGWAALPFDARPEAWQTIYPSKE